MAHQDYPKMLYRDGWKLGDWRIVNDADEEEAVMKQGFARRLSKDEIAEHEAAAAAAAEAKTGGAVNASTTGGDGDLGAGTTTGNDAAEQGAGRRAKGAGTTTGKASR